MVTYSKLVEELWPLINEYIQGAYGYQLGLVSSGGGSTIGALSPSDYPDALLRDGSRSLLGDMSVATGKTIDGVDLSEHYASYINHLTADSHTRYVDITNARTITAQHTFAPTSTRAPFVLGANAQGQTVTGFKADQLNKQVIAGSGLINGGTLTANVTLDVGAGVGITVNANDVAVDQAYNFAFTGNNSFGTGTLSFTNVPAFNRGTVGPPFTLNANAQGQTVTGLRADQLNKQVIAGSGLINGGTLTSDITVNVGAGNGITVNTDDVAVNQAYTFAWTGTQTWATTATFNGAVNVNNDATFTDNLVVGSNVLYVDPVGQRVGINTVPDPQFQLDVNGNTRTSGYFVGKHAIQIPDAVAIMHYDGKTGALNFTGSALGHKGQTATATGGVIYRVGKFGKALQIAEATTNLVRNPVAAVDTSNTTGTTATITRVVGDGVIGDTCFKVVLSSSFGHLRITCNSFASSTTYAVSGHVKGVAGQQVRLSFFDGVAEKGLKVITLTGGWQYVYVTATSDAATTALQWMMRGLSTSTQEFYVSGAQVEQKSYHTPIAIGYMGSGYSWGGTAHASSSLRTAAKLLYTASEVMPAYNTFAELSIGFWLYINDPAGTPAIDRYIFELYESGKGYIRIYRKTSTDQIFVDTNNNTSTGSQSLDLSVQSITTDSWNYIVWTYTPSTTANQGTGNLYINGTLVTSSTAYLPITSWGTSVAVGSLIAGGSELNSFIDDLCIVARTMSIDEIKAIYQSNAPVFAETSTWGFQTPNTLAWANEYGLFAIDNSGNAAFGVSGVDTFTWGGATLDKGDILIGRVASNVGSMLWDSSASTLSLTGVLNIGTGGGIFQGTGTFSSPTTGLKMSNSSGIGILEGYKSGTLQARFNSSGEIEGGGGVARLTADGFEVDADTVYDIKRAYSFLDNGGTGFGGIDAAYNIGPTTRAINIRATHANATAVEINLVTTNTAAPTAREVKLDTYRFRAIDTLLRLGGTSFPSSPITDDLFYRTDRDLLYFYDGTQWLTVNVYAQHVSEFVFSGTGTAPMIPIRTDYAVYVTKIVTSYNVATTHDGSNHWSITWRAYEATRTTQTTLNADVTTWAASTAANTWATIELVPTTPNPTNRAFLMMGATKVGSPGNATIAANFYYRLIG